MNNYLDGDWKGTETDELGIKIDCGHCGSLVGPAKHYKFNSNLPGFIEANILICPNCNKPTYYRVVDGVHKMQIPSVSFGNTVSYLPEDIHELYEEARNCIVVNAYTASVLCSRKLLMNIAVSKGAEEGESFQHYVKYLNENHFTPPESNDWVDHIRRKGNEATHEIPSVGGEDAKELLSFAEMLLRFIYELPGKMQAYSSVNNS